MTQPDRMPVMFVGHGNPMNAIERNAFSAQWAELGRTLPKPKAIVCLSAHWETEGLRVTSSAQPETIHDFYGFPKALFDVQYRAPGDPALAREIVDLLKPTQVTEDEQRGLDHGVWGVLAPMFPEADIPVVQLSLWRGKSARYHFELGQRLATLRRQGVLVVASGNIVHNLRTFDFNATEATPWAAEFDAKVQSALLNRDFDALVDYQSLGRQATLAIPSAEHYLPFVLALGLVEPDDQIQLFNPKTLSSISMTSFLAS